MSEPKREDYADIMAYIRAHGEWEESTDEGKASVAERLRREAERKAEEERRYQEMLGPAMVKYVDGLGIPARALEAMRGTREETKAIQASTGALDFLVLSGGPGCGKTVAAALWISSYVSDHSLWSNESRLGLRPAPSFHGSAPIWVTAAKLARCDRYDENHMTKLLRTPRLVIDDLGGEYLDKGGFYASLLDEIVNERQAESKPTIMTTNLNAEAFKERYGERIVDRIREGGRFVGCGDQSLRRKAAA